MVAISRSRVPQHPLRAGQRGGIGDERLSPLHRINSYTGYTEYVSFNLLRTAQRNEIILAVQINPEQGTGGGRGGVEGHDSAITPPCSICSAAFVHYMGSDKLRTAVLLVLRPEGAH